MKPFFTLTGGFLGLLFFEGFARLVITFYHRIDFHFYGISALPSNIWIAIILISVLISTWLLTMLILTIINKNSLYYSLIFGALIFCWRGVEVYNSYHLEPTWYFVSIFLLHLVGITLAYNLFKRQHEILPNP